MPPKIRSAYGGGYSDAIKRQLERIVIPDKIKCMSCKLIKSQSSFSNKQLIDLRHTIYMDDFDPTTTGVIRCRDCVGLPALEIRCSVCDEVKGLSEFAKNQRHNKDEARCLACVQFHRDADPLWDEQKMLTDREHFPLQGSTATASQLDERSLLASHSDDGGTALSQDGWVERDIEPRSLVRGRQGLTGYDEEPPITPFGGSIHSDWLSSGILSRPAGTDYVANHPKTNSKFPRIPAFVSRPTPVERSPMITKKTVCKDEEEEEGDNIEDFL